MDGYRDQNRKGLNLPFAPPRVAEGVRGLLGRFQTLTEIAGEKNSTIIPIPLEIANTIHAIGKKAGVPGLLANE